MWVLKIFVSIKKVSQSQKDREIKIKVVPEGELKGVISFINDVVDDLLDIYIDLIADLYLIPSEESELLIELQQEKEMLIKYEWKKKPGSQQNIKLALLIAVGAAIAVYIAGVAYEKATLIEKTLRNIGRFPLFEEWSDEGKQNL